MGDSESAPADPPAALTVNNEPDNQPDLRPALAPIQRQATPPSTQSNGNIGCPSGSAPMQPGFSRQVVAHNQQQQMFCQGQQQIPYQAHQQIPYQTQQQMAYQGQQQMPYQGQQQMPYQGQQQVPYQGQQQMPYQGQQQVPYQGQQQMPYQNQQINFKAQQNSHGQFPNTHPYHCSQNAAASLVASSAGGCGWPSPQPSTSKGPTPPQRRPSRKVGRPRKYPLPEHQDDDDPAPLPAAAAGSAPCVVDVPPRDEHDVCVGQSKVSKCATCTLWTGRYLLEPCFHHGFCISCLEANANIDKAQNKQPACPACDTTITKYVPGIRATIMDVNLDN